MIEVISVRFRGGCKAYFFDPKGVAVSEGEEVVVETAQGAEVGTCVCANHTVEDYAVIQPLRPMVRIVTEEDRKTIQRNRKKEKESIRERNTAETMRKHGILPEKDADADTAGTPETVSPITRMLQEALDKALKGGPDGNDHP